MILNSPANPTGGFLDKTDIEAVADVLRDHDCYVLSDEIYSRILYGGEHYSVAAGPGLLDRTIILDGFSKTYAMTGWRLGYGVFPTELIPHIGRLAVNSVSCTNAATQMAGVAALTGPQAWRRADGGGVREAARLHRGRAERDPRITCKKPLGAFYVFPNVKGLGLSSKVLADKILDEAAGRLERDGVRGVRRGVLGCRTNSIPNIEKALGSDRGAGEDAGVRLLTFDPLSRARERGRGATAFDKGRSRFENRSGVRSQSAGAERRQWRRRCDAQEEAAMARVVGLGHVGIYVRDLERMVAFYRDFLGMQITKQNWDRGMVFLSSNPVASDHEIALMRGRPGERRSASDQPDLDAGGVAGRPAGVPQASGRRWVPPGAGVNYGSAIGCYFRDPEGNTTEVFWRSPRDCWVPTGDRSTCRSRRRHHGAGQRGG